MNQRSAREIMGKNFFGVEESIKYYGVNPTSWQLSMLAEIPFSEATLQKLKNTHILDAVFPISILEIYENLYKSLFYTSHHTVWCSVDKAFRERGEMGWQLIRKTPITDSIFKDWEKQKALLSKDEEVPIAQVMVYTIIGCYLATNERLFEKFYVRTSSMDSESDCISVGIFDSRGLKFGSYWNSVRDNRLGLSSAQKRILI